MHVCITGGIGIAEFAGLEKDGPSKNGVEFAELKLLPLFVRHIYFRCDGDTPWRCEYYCH